ncbi:MAG: hypothetical protein K1X48_03195 [Burkholderiaceae bacterium]|nr:hypothetical protein [Burkholderiaceae bacterium]
MNTSKRQKTDAYLAQHSSQCSSTTRQSNNDRHGLEKKSQDQYGPS